MFHKEGALTLTCTKIRTLMLAHWKVWTL